MRSEKDRKRYRTAAFRMSEDEWIELNKRVELCGYQKQEYLIKSVLYQQIVVVGNKVQFTRLQATLDDIACQLEQIEAASELDSELLLPIRTAVEIISNAFTESSESISLVVADEKTMKCEPKTTNNKTNRLNVLKESAGN